MRRKIVSFISGAMDIPPEYVIPFCPKDHLAKVPKVLEKQSGGATIFVSLETGLFHNLVKADDPNEIKEAKATLIQGVLAGLASIVWNTFDGKYEVEAFVGDLNPDHKVLLKAKE